MTMIVFIFLIFGLSMSAATGNQTNNKMSKCKSLILNDIFSPFLDIVII